MDQMHSDRYQPKKGPALIPIVKKVLQRIYAEEDLGGVDPIRSAENESLIAFYLRQNCRCPADSQWCMCGGGFTVSDGRRSP
jgi:hypothetical protein